MNPDTLKVIFTYTVTVFILASGFYALVLYQYALPELVQGAFIGFMGAAIAFVYGDQVATRTSHAQQRAFDSGLASPTPQDKA